MNGKDAKKGKEYAALGKTSKAREQFAKAVDITPTMAWHCIVALRDCGITCIVAPYEADAQLAFLACTGKVDFVISEDSDCIAYGIPMVFTKMDKNGFGVVYRCV